MKISFVWSHNLKYKLSNYYYRLLKKKDSIYSITFMEWIEFSSFKTHIKWSMCNIVNEQKPSNKHVVYRCNLLTVSMYGNINPSHTKPESCCYCVPINIYIIFTWNGYAVLSNLEYDFMCIVFWLCVCLCTLCVPVGTENWIWNVWNVWKSSQWF